MEEINLKELFEYFKSKILIILLIIVIVVSVSNIVTIIFRKPKYSSNSTIVLVSKQGENVSYTSSEYQLNKNLVTTYSEIIKSRKVLNQVIENLNLKISANELSENIKVDAVSDTEIIRITVSNKSSKLAKKITNEIAKVFIKEVKEIYNLENVSVVDEAIESSKPYNINYIKDNLIYLAGGFVISFLIVFIIYYFDTTIKSSEIIEDKFNLTILSMVPKGEDE